MPKVALMGKIHKDGLKILEDSQFNFIEITDYSYNNLSKELTDVDAIALRTAKLSQTILQECKSLKIVARHGVGYDNVDINYLNKEKIALAITGSANAVTVAEHVVSMFFCLCKNSKISDQFVRDGNFKNRESLQDTLELYQKNIFILGLGRIGKALAKRCNGFETKVYVYDPYIESKIIKENNCIPISFEEGIKIADFISLHLPINENTKHLITKKELTQMKNSCILVNTSRGGIIKEEDLLWALQNKVIHSAGLDVFEQEPPNKNNPLFLLKNLILSPHTAALTLECKKRMGVETCKNIVNYLTGSRNLISSNIVNKNIIN